MASAAAPGRGTRAGNIGPRGRRQRRILGLASLAGAVGILLMLERYGVSRWWRLAVFPVWTLSALGVVQAQARTCVALAARGTCDAEMGGRLEPAEAQALARRGVMVLRASVLIAAVATGIAVALP